MATRWPVSYLIYCFYCLHIVFINRFFVCENFLQRYHFFVVTSYSLFLSGWEEENSKIFAGGDLVDLAIVIIFAV